ncbi:MULTISPECIES: dihydrodipicolinate synthase family protein [Actinomyces]|uniref:Dihydrodipicolinate synthase family protein n=1 Tax=Actinomyces respiraculi TaxID=2744574 RepID=A0A7T0LML3_9ACTO|nr:MULTISPECIES: dihydrodipicolinate synthase family protein [Actinomyces]QPL05898.1 dihydrodipicolinate synthase family protein [Actinomyces respiraculi]
MAAHLQQGLHGICAISITPFLEDGTFDAKGYRKNLSYMIKNGVDSTNSVIVVGGSTGECGAMSLNERNRVLDVALEFGDRLNVVAGCNSTNVDDAIALARYAQDNGAIGAMVLAPYYYPAKDRRSILEFVKKFAASVDIGILIYNNVEVMGLDMPVDIIDELADIENVVGLKECTPSCYKMGRSADIAGARLAVVNGHGEFLEPMAALLGTTGFISSMANFAPRQSAAIWAARSRGDFAAAKEIRDQLRPYMDLAVRFSGEGGEYKVISLLKHATDLVGSVGGFPRIPCPTLTDEEKAEIQRAIANCGLI